MTLRNTVRSLAAAAAFAHATIVYGQTAHADWAESPEAYFLTAEERTEWARLTDAGEREAFKQRYWSRRDPTPGTERNEFREIVEQRIAAADQQFRIEDTPGSQTARGLVFIVFGPPSRKTNAYTTPTPLPGGGPTPQDPLAELNEIRLRWTYEKRRNAKLLRLLDLPELQIEFTIEPTRRRDTVQQPGLVNRYRETIAQNSIITTAAASRPGAIEATPGADLTERVVRMLDAVPSGSAGALQSAVTWSSDGPPITSLWLLLPSGQASGSDAMLHGRVRDSNGRDVANVRRLLDFESGFSTISNTSVAVARLQLPAGKYHATVVAERGGVAIGSGTASFVVPDVSAFAVTSLVLTGTPQAAGGGVMLGEKVVQPRGDSVFPKSESLWYLFGAANVSEAAGAVVRTIVRRGAEAPGQPIVLPASLQAAGEGRYVGGFELPLAGFEPGAYTLYVTIADPQKGHETRRADFRVVQ